ncbi:MAG TPA: hypothetical protein DDZ89_12300 [Clostridiales bacterium]|nr:hypothetical protein [Clostridiales bacterium]
MDYGRINIFTGHFGSGKTETALNFAVALLNKGHKTYLADMDIVNPYFRSADAKERMENLGMKVIAPVYANTNVDVPALPAEVNKVFENKELVAVLDIGGDDLGARAVATYRKKILNEDYRHFFVVNVKRPLTETVEGIIRYVNDIETTSGVKVTGLVNNTNLMQFTTINDIMEGNEIIQKAAHQLNIPVSFHCIMEDLLTGVETEQKNSALSQHFLEKEKEIILPMIKYIGNKWGV